MVTNGPGVNVATGSHVSRFALSDGHPEWDRELSGVLGRPAVGGNRVFVGSTDNYFYALDDPKRASCVESSRWWRCRRRGGR